MCCSWIKKIHREFKKLYIYFENCICIWEWQNDKNFNWGGAVKILYNIRKRDEKRINMQIYVFVSFILLILYNFNAYQIISAQVCLCVVNIVLIFVVYKKLYLLFKYDVKSNGQPWIIYDLQNLIYI